MTPKLISAEYVGQYRVRIAFEDGCEGELDLESELWGEVFESLRDPEIFRAFHLSEELNTLTWPSGADFAPEFLYEQVVRQATA
jgi:hypothetical protein